MTISVSRGGGTFCSDATLSQYPTQGGYVHLSFRAGSDERMSTFTVYIQPDSFDELASAMMRAGPQAAIKAFGLALTKAKLD